MSQNLENNKTAIEKIVSEVAAKKKKAVVAGGLILIMCFMWGRMFFSKGPNEIAAAQNNTGNIANSTNSSLKIEFVELPVVKGRHDVLVRDFFVFDKAGLGKSQTVDVLSAGSENENIIKTVREKLKLQAIDMGQTRHAFINDKLLNVGDKIEIAIGSSLLDCEIMSIEKDVVTIRYKDVKIVLKLSQEMQAVR